MYGASVLRVLTQLHVGLLVYRYVPERTACMDMNWGDIAGGGDSDDRTVLDRIAEASVYELVSAAEIVIMFTCILWGTIRASRSKPQSYLSGVGLLLPALLLVSALSIRSRHTGIFGCATGDPECCGNMYCSDTTGHKVPGCPTAKPDGSNSITIRDWHKRTSYCPVPPWYKPQQCSDSLRGTPDLAACYQYGCSAENTPIPYYSGRLEFATVVVFSIVAITS